MFLQEVLTGGAKGPSPPAASCSGQPDLTIKQQVEPDDTIKHQVQPDDTIKHTIRFNPDFAS